jgi:hypothetical protein
MSHVAEIASAAGNISAEKLAEAHQEAQVNIIKMNMDAQVMVQQELADMIREIQPHLANHVNITA